MTVDARTLYEAALYGEPIDRTVRPEPLNTGPTLWTLGDWQVIFPAPVPRPAPGMQLGVRQIREWTGWAARRLADIVGTSHTTILSVEGGRSLVDGHSGDLRRRLSDVHDVTERVHLLAGRDPGLVARVMDTAPPGRRAAVEELKADDPGRAYLAAIDILRPRTPGLLLGDRPRRSGGAAALHD